MAQVAVEASWRRVGLGALMALAWCTGGCATRERQGVGGPEFYRTLQASSVAVLVNGRMHGSGFFVAPDGLVVTAAHVVRGKPKPKDVELLSASLGRMKARIVAVDASHDVAVLAAPPRAEAYPALAVTDRPPAPGGRAWLMGNPLFRHDLMLSGTVATDAPTYCYNGDLQCYTRVLYMAGASPKGSSGGCWVDSDARVVGVQSGYLGPEKSWGGIATVGHPGGVSRLIAARKSIETATLGAQLDELWTQPAGFIRRFVPGTSGVATVRPHKDGPVAKAGLNKESVIIAIDGYSVRYCDELLNYVRSKRPGDTVTLTILDPDKKPEHKVKVRLEAIPQ